ncbi:MAG: S1-like domain-containing RNA-binding protein [Balneolales bacterium]
MFKLGAYQNLKVVKNTTFGYFLENEEGVEVLLPHSQVANEIQTGDDISVFLYRDGEERLTATMNKPLISIKSIAPLRVKQVNDYGAYLDWGLSKDLFVPYREQTVKMKEGETWLVYLYLDEQSDRLTATAKVEGHLDQNDITVEEREEVELLIWDQTDLGYNVIINQKHKGLIYHNELFTDVHYGEAKKGYVKQVRPDNKIDVTLHPIGYDKIEPNADRILHLLEQNSGFLGLHDKSGPDEIRNRLQMSKKTFKQAIGQLYKKEIIRIGDEGIYLKRV